MNPIQRAWLKVLQPVAYFVNEKLAKRSGRTELTEASSENSADYSRLAQESSVFTHRSEHSDWLTTSC